MNRKKILVVLDMIMRKPESSESSETSSALIDDPGRMLPINTNYIKSSWNVNLLLGTYGGRDFLMCRVSSEGRKNRSRG